MGCYSARTCRWVVTVYRIVSHIGITVERLWTGDGRAARKRIRAGEAALHVAIVARVCIIQSCFVIPLIAGVFLSRFVRGQVTDCCITLRRRAQAGVRHQLFAEGEIVMPPGVCQTARLVKDQARDRASEGEAVGNQCVSEA